MNPEACRPPLSAEDLLRILPHRPPMLLLDRVIEADDEQVVALKQLSGKDVFMQGHFPGRPVLPGAMLIEIMAQAGLVLYHYNAPVESLFFLGKAAARFLRPVEPPCELRITVRRIRIIGKMGLVAAEVHVGAEKMAEAELAFASPS